MSNRGDAAVEERTLTNIDPILMAIAFRKHLVDPHRPYDQVVRYTHVDGSTVWVRCTGIAIRDDPSVDRNRPTSIRSTLAPTWKRWLRVRVPPTP